MIEVSKSWRERKDPRGTGKLLPLTVAHLNGSSQERVTQNCGMSKSVGATDQDKDPCVSGILKNPQCKRIMLDNPTVVNE